MIVISPTEYLINPRNLSYAKIILHTSLIDDKKTIVFVHGSTSGV